MPKKKVSGSIANQVPDPFTTIDDLLHQSEELTAGLRKLGGYKHPLAIRRGVGRRKGVREDMTKAEKKAEQEGPKVTRTEKGLQVRAGGRYYFLDVEEAKTGDKYLRVTESRSKGPDKPRERKTIIVFQEDARDFAGAVSDMVSEMIGPKGKKS